MAFINTIQPARATGQTREMYALQQDHWGYVPNYAKVFGDRPEVMARWGRLLAEIRRPVDNRRFELITFAVARELEHSACCLVHGQALAEIIGTDAVVAMARGQMPAELTEAEQALVAFALAVTRDATSTTSEQVEDLKSLHGMSDEDIFDVVAIAAGRCFFTKMVDALGATPDKALVSVDERLRAALAFGRPISAEEDELITSPDEITGLSGEAIQEESSTC